MSELPPSHIAAPILLRLAERVPADCALSDDAVVTGLMAYLSGMRWDDDAGLFQIVEAACSIPTSRGVMSIGTWAGALQMLSFGSVEEWAEHAEQTDEGMTKGVPLGEWSPWFCTFCKRKWMDGAEPDACPDCDHPLTRLMKAQEG